MSQSEVTPIAPEQTALSEPGVAVCPLNDLPQNLHQYLHALNDRVTALETNAAEQHARLLAMGKRIFSMPQTKMMLAAFPKDMQNAIREFFGDSNAVTEKTNGNR